MKKKLWQFSGKAAFWLVWPALFVYLFVSERSRILVVCGDEILVVKGWLGMGGWGLPGGGLHKGEVPAKGALRELKEETGIDVNATELQKIYSGRSIREFGLSYKVHAFALFLDRKPKLSRQKLELTHLEWIKRQKLYDDPKTSKNIIDIIDAWQNSL